MEAVEQAQDGRRKMMWQVLAFLLSLFMAWWMLPDLDPLQSDAAAHWYRVFCDHSEPAQAGDSTWMSILGRSLSAPMILPELAVLGFFGLGAMVLLLFGSFNLLHKQTGDPLIAIFGTYYLANLLQPLWHAVDFGSGVAMTVLLAFAALAAVLTGHYRLMGLSLAILFVDSPVSLALAAVILPFAIFSAKPKGKQVLVLALEVLKWGLLPVLALLMLSYLMGSSYHLSTLDAIAQGPLQLADFLQESMVAKLVTQPVNATALLLNLAILVWSVLVRLLKKPMPAFSLLPMLAFVALVFQEQLFPLTDGASAHVGAMLLWIQVLMAMSCLDAKYGKQGKYNWAVIVVIFALDFNGLLRYKTTEDLPLRKRVAAEHLEAAHFLNTVPGISDKVLVIDGLPAAFRFHEVRVMSRSHDSGRVLREIAAYKPQLVALPGYMVYREKLPAMGYAETLIFREGNLLGEASLRVWERLKPNTPMQIHPPIPLDSIAGTVVSRIEGLEVSEIRGQELVFRITDRRVRAVRMGIVQPGEGEYLMLVARQTEEAKLAPFELPLAHDALKDGRLVHSIEIEIPFSEGAREIRILLKDGGEIRTFDPELVY